MVPNGGRKSKHSDYSHHADVGSCCASKVRNTFDFQKRKTATEYQASRRGVNAA